jgi:hypothetical protein
VLEILAAQMLVIVTDNLIHTRINFNGSSFRKREEDDADAGTAEDARRQNGDEKRERCESASTGQLCGER